MFNITRACSCSWKSFINLPTS